MIFQIVWPNWAGLGCCNGFATDLPLRIRTVQSVRGKERGRGGEERRETCQFAAICHGRHGAGTHLAQWELIDAFSAGILTKPARRALGELRAPCGRQQGGRLSWCALSGLWALGSWLLAGWS